MENRFMVTIDTADKIVDDNELLEMAQNIANAIINEANTKGIVPENSETFTEIVRVKHWYGEKEIIEHTY